MTPDFFLYLLLGAFAGTAAGLLGIGGGLIIVPTLAWIFTRQGMEPDLIMHLAIGTSLASIVFTSISSVRAHHLRGSVLWRNVWLLSPGLLLGAGLGAWIADALSSNLLRIIFGLFELYVAIQMTINRKPAPHRDIPGPVGSSISGGIIGCCSSIVGIGGGTLTVPFLLWCNTTIQKAIATSAACGLPIAIAGALGFLITGLDASNLPTNTMGYIYLPALIGVVATSILFAPFGAYLAHTLPTKILKRVFAGLLFLLAIKMLLG